MTLGGRPPPSPLPALPARAFALWGVDGAAPQPLGGSQCLVFGLDREDPWIVLRLELGGWGRLLSLRTELDWLCHLARRGAPVSAPLPSLHGRLVERLHDGAGRRYLATCLRRACGEPVDSLRSEVWNPALFRLCGGTLGQIHASSRGFTLRLGACPRHLNSRGFVWLARRVLPRGDGAVLRRIERYCARFARLPRGHADYGLIHADFHQGNYCLDGNRIEVFDFGNARCGWYAADVAISLYASLLDRVGRGETRLEPYASAYFVPFLRGYTEVTGPLGVAFEHLGDFVEFFNLSILVSFFAAPRAPAGRLFEFVSERARSGKPCLDLDFGKLMALAVAGPGKDARDGQ
jgi:amicoumacin kinase